MIDILKYNAAANLLDRHINETQHPVSAEIYAYTGTITASALNIFDSKKMYMALYIALGTNIPTAAPTPPEVMFYDQANALFFYGNKAIVTFNAGYQYLSQNLILENIHFSRFTATVYTKVYFVGLLYNLP